MSADQAIHLARHLRLREGGMVLDRIIHEAPAYLKPHRTCSHRSTMTKASGVLGASALFLYERDRRKLS